jgi:hypothetical protein
MIPGLAAAADDRVYQVHYQVDLAPETASANVAIEIKQPRGYLRQLTFTAPQDRYRGFAADGELQVDGATVTWRVPRKGGTLRFSHLIDHRRAGGGYDARITPTWALFKADKLIPRVSSRALAGARARASLSFTGPADWLFQSRYGRHRGAIAIDDPGRGFDRPTGWIVAGHIASRREDIADRYVMVAGPAGQGLRHNDMLAFLTWTLPTLVDVLPTFPNRLLIVSATDGTWRGGLSGEASLYVHGGRPFISQNGTSTILHELVHVGSRLSGRDGGDWIVEGLAEYYSLELLFRSGTISKRRYDLALADLRKWSVSAPDCILTDQSKGPNTARAVLVLHEIDAEVRRDTGERASLDDIMRELAVRRDPVTPTLFGKLLERVMGESSAVLARVTRCTASS